EKLGDLVLEGEINAAMVGDVQDMPARIDDWLLFEERYVAVLAPTHQLANRPSIGIDDLRETVLLERAGCDVAPKIQRSYFPEEPPHLAHCSRHDLHLQHMAAAGSSPGCAFVCGSNAFVDIAVDAALALRLEAGAIKTERYGA